MSHATRQTPNRTKARAIAAPRTVVMPAALITLILSVIVGLLLGAAWMQLT